MAWKSLGDELKMGACPIRFANSKVPLEEITDLLMLIYTPNPLIRER